MNTLGISPTLSKLLALAILAALVMGTVNLAVLPLLDRFEAAEARLVDAAGFAGFYRRVAERAAAACNAHVGGRLDLEAVLFDFEGRVLARAWDRRRPAGAMP